MGRLCAVILCTLLWELCFFLAQGQSGSSFLSIDCGSPDESYTDPDTTLTYVSDSPQYMKLGKTWTVDSAYTAGKPKVFRTLRSFPDGNKTCYMLQPVDPGSKYLIRASFLYGNYDGLDSPPSFDLYLGVTMVQSVVVDVSNWVQFEFIIIARTKYVFVCLVKTTAGGTPFISALELRPITGSTIYGVVTETLALKTFIRFNLGDEKPYRYPKDVFDRYWYSTPGGGLNASSASSDISMATDPYLPPTIAMQTAAISASGISWKPPVPNTTSAFMCNHFAELETVKSTDLREMQIYLNGLPWLGPFTPSYLQAMNVCSDGTFKTGSNGTEFQWRPTYRSTLPVLLNAFELYTAVELSASHTDDTDVDAVVAIRDHYNITKRWTGDPCLPFHYESWENLLCSTDTTIPRIQTVSLSKSELRGFIHEAFGNLGALVNLNLAGNNLTGDIPDSLGGLPFLAELDLSNNDLSGDVPESLLRKTQSGKLKLNISGNPKLCSTEDCRKKKKKKWLFIVEMASIPVGVILVYVLVSCSIVLCLKNRRKRARSRDPPAGEVVDAHVGRDHSKEVEMANGPSSSFQAFTFSQVTNITNNFGRRIGEGSYGPVFYGELPGGHNVAVKILSPDSRQGLTEFRAEVDMFSRVRHENIVSFYGYCAEDQHMILIYEYIPGGNLAKALSGDGALHWNQRLQIALGSARGLEYLHQCRPPIIHRDVKSSNILLNENFVPKIADFGLSKSGMPNNATHISTAVKGTPGYLDPQYSSTNRLNEKSDVYSLGVVLLELATGKSPIIVRSPEERTHIVEWVKNNLKKGDRELIFDPIVLGNCDVRSFWKVVRLALRCTEYSGKDRPSMSEVVSELKEAIFLNRGI